MESENITRIVLFAVALGMGVSSLIMGFLDVNENVGMFLGIGLVCLAIAGLDSVDKE